MSATTEMIAAIHPATSLLPSTSSPGTETHRTEIDERYGRASL